MRVSYALCPLTCLRHLTLPGDVRGRRSWEPAIATLLAALPNLRALSAPGFTILTDSLGLLFPCQLTQLSELRCCDIQRQVAYVEEEEQNLASPQLSYSLHALRFLQITPSEYSLPISEVALKSTSLHLCSTYNATSAPSLFFSDESGEDRVLADLRRLTIAYMDLETDACRARAQASLT